VCLALYYEIEFLSSDAQRAADVTGEVPALASRIAGLEPERPAEPEAADTCDVRAAVPVDGCQPAGVAAGSAGPRRLGHGEPWQYYDLGHGLCSYTFFEQCPHRMACAKCDFYTPKNSSKAQLLEAKDNLQRMLASIPLTDEERAAVDDGQAALDSLLGRLADIPTPAGATPRQLGASPAPTLLPIIDVRQGKTG
jgi:hypothetical protein